MSSENPMQEQEVLLFLGNATRNFLSKGENLMTFDQTGDVGYWLHLFHVSSSKSIRNGAWAKVEEMAHTILKTRLGTVILFTTPGDSAQWQIHLTGNQEIGAAHMNTKGDRYSMTMGWNKVHVGNRDDREFAIVASSVLLELFYLLISTDECPRELVSALLASELERFLVND